MIARERNATAKALALADADRIATEMAASAWLRKQLARWPDPEDTPPFTPDPANPHLAGGIHPAWIADGAATHLEQIRNEVWRLALNPKRTHRSMARWAIEKLAELPEAPDSETGLSMLAAWWAQRPREAETVDDLQRTLFPAPVIHRPERGTWKRFNLPAKRRNQLVIPGFDAARRGIVTPDIPLDWWEALGEASSSRGAFTMATRLFAAALMSSKLADRNGNRFVRRTVGKWFPWLHPDPARANRYRLWRDLRDAFAVIDNLPRVTFRYPDGGQEAIKLVSVHGVPPRNDPSDRLSMQISFPPGADVYSVAMPWGNVLLWGVTLRRSRVAALLMRLAMRWAEPNHGRLKVGKPPRQRWVEDRNPAKYRPIGEAEAVALVAPQGGSDRTPSVAAQDLASLAGTGDVLLFGTGGKPIAWRGRATRHRPPEPDAKMVRNVRDAMRAGTLRALPPGQG